MQLSDADLTAAREALARFAALTAQPLRMEDPAQQQPAGNPAGNHQEQTDTMQIKIAPCSNCPGKLADAELHFTDGPLSGLKLIGFGIWERGRGTGQINVTFPARQYAVNGERRSFALLRPADGDINQGCHRRRMARPRRRPGRATARPGHEQPQGEHAATGRTREHHDR
jgi:hypothetical protein